MKAIGYVRVSTQVQVKEGQGLEVQREQIKKYCQDNNLELISIYEDKGISGAKADEETLSIESIDREGLQDMIAEIPFLDVKYVVVANTSRLWRSDYVKVLIQRDLKKHDVDVRSVEQPTYSMYNKDDPSQFLINGLMELLDQFQRLEIALKLKRGKLSKAKRGGFAGGTRALGYKKIKKDRKPELAIDLDEAQTVSLIKKLRRKGLSMQKIADHLNSGGIETKRGGKWFASTVKYILDNTLYRGVLRHNSIINRRPELAIK